MQVMLALGYFLMWDYILSGIIQGQIIDAFAEMRAAEDAKILDEHERCMICSLSRFDVDSNGGKFHQHISRDHVPKSYLFYFVHLEKVGAQEDDGMMTYVRDCVERASIQFIPIGTCEIMNKDESKVIVTNADLNTQVSTLAQTESERIRALEVKVQDMTDKLEAALAQFEAR